MKFLLDTNVVSEWVKPRPNAGLIEWLTRVEEDDTYLSVVTITELRYGIERLDAGGRRRRLQGWLERDLMQRFDARVLPIEARVADECGRILACRAAKGRPMEVMDAYLAATCAVYELSLVTRNAADFAGALERVVNPWT